LSLVITLFVTSLVFQSFPRPTVSSQSHSTFAESGSPDFIVCVFLFMLPCLIPFDSNSISPSSEKSSNFHLSLIVSCEIWRVLFSPHQIFVSIFCVIFCSSHRSVLSSSFSSVVTFSDVFL